MADDNSEADTQPLDARRRQAHWRANHRGTKEMDVMLGRFAEARLGTFGEHELAAFEALIQRPDPELSAELLAPVCPANAGLIAAIRRFHGLDG